jgi:hypothetical protein
VVGELLALDQVARSLHCITMSAPLDAIRLLLIGFGKKEPEFGSYAGQLDTGHGVEFLVGSTGLGLARIGSLD